MISDDYRRAVYDAEMARRAALREAGEAIAAVAEDHRHAVLAARTLGDDLTPHAGRGELATFGETAGQRVDVAETYARLIAVAAERVQLYGAQLAAAYAKSGQAALVHTVYLVDPDTGELVTNGESETALVRMERKEREILERLIVQGARLGMEQRRAEAAARGAAVLAGGMRKFVEDGGGDWSDPLVRRRAQVALLAARAETEQAERVASDRGGG